MGLALITPPVGYPVTLNEAKAHLRVDHDNDNAFITGLIGAATEFAQGYCNVSLIRQTWEETFDCFPAACIELAKPPLISVTSISYVDTAGDSQVWGASNYEVDTKSVFARITPAYGVVWPSTQSAMNAVTIRFVAGFGDDASAVPQSIKQGMLMYIADLYDNRQSKVMGVSVADASTTAMALLNQERRVRFR